MSDTESKEASFGAAVTPLEEENNGDAAVIAGRLKSYWRYFPSR